MRLSLRQLWLFARIELGLTKEEFNALTPAEWRLAVELWMGREKRKRARQDELIARLAYFINLSVVPRKPGDKLPQMDDFLPKRSKTKRKNGKALSPTELLRKTQEIFGD